MSPWMMLVLFLIGNGLLVGGILMLARAMGGRANPILSTFVLLVGMTMLLHFGTPELLNDLIAAVAKSLK